MITLAKDGMRQDLERMWRLSFPDDRNEGIKYFFDYRYNPNACIVYVDEVGGRPVSMLHLLDATITDDSEILPVLYLYAAATRPDHRGKGYMSKLIEAAQKFALSRRAVYTILKPENKRLFKFYEKHGYYRCFQNRVFTLTRREAEIISEYARHADEGPDRGEELSESDIFAIRRNTLVDREGYVGWDSRACAYALGLNRVDGGRVFSVASSYDAAYAVCRAGAEIGHIEITEFVASPELYKRLIRVILDGCAGETFSFRVPASEEYFSAYGDMADFGMIRAANDRKPTGLLTLTGKHLPYLGLPLD